MKNILQIFEKMQPKPHHEDNIGMAVPCGEVYYYNPLWVSGSTAQQSIENTDYPGKNFYQAKTEKYLVD